MTVPSVATVPVPRYIRRATEDDRRHLLINMRLRIAALMIESAGGLKALNRATGLEINVAWQNRRMRRHHAEAVIASLRTAGAGELFRVDELIHDPSRED